MHTASGSFVQGHYARSEFINGEEARFWMIQAGITKNWFGLGNTSLYGEYGECGGLHQVWCGSPGGSSYRWLASCQL